MPTVLGNQDKDVSDYLKAFISGGSDMVVGLIGEGTSMELVSNWSSPFEGDSLGSLFGKVGDILQMTTNLSSITALASHQIWEGNEPHLFNLVLKFYALSDPVSEVMAPLKALEKMMLPNVSRVFPVGRIPQPVQINIGRKFLYNDCVITNMSVPLDKERDKNGNLVRCEVNLQVETLEMAVGQAKEK